MDNLEIFKTITISTVLYTAGYFGTRKYLPAPLDHKGEEVLGLNTPTRNFFVKTKYSLFFAYISTFLGVWSYMVDGIDPTRKGKEVIYKIYR